MPDEIGRVTILAIGVWQYRHLDQLTGPEMDLKNIQDIFVDDPDIAIFQRRQFHPLPNPTSEQLRHAINEYVKGRGTDNDILVFYFSGHGVAVGANDFAFCTIDTDELTEQRAILPMTSVSFTEILRTLWIRKIIPVFIIDACYSGMAGGALTTMFNELSEELKGEVQRRYGSSYALFCSTPNNEQIRDNPHGDGGLLSTELVKIAQEGLGKRDKRVETITLSKLFPILHQKTEVNDFGSSPILLLGPTLPDFSVINNINFQPLEYRLQPHLVAVLRVLWNNGNTQELRPGEISDETGLKGAYGNHNKLSFEPWNLVETNGNRRRLNDRGIAFMHGELHVPRDIVKNNEQNIYIAKDNSEMVGIENFPE